MKKVYIVKSQLSVVASDARYTVTFAVEHLRGKTWEFDTMSDDNSYRDVKSNKVKVIVKPDLASMAFPEDANRPLEYVVDIEKARELWLLVDNEDLLMWYFLDLLSLYSGSKSFDHHDVVRDYNDALELYELGRISLKDLNSYSKYFAKILAEQI